jgi:hypothetical protein
MVVSDDAIRSFFTRYGEALTSGQPDTIAACYVAPALVVGDRGAKAISDIAQVAADFSGSAERYAAAGLVHAVAAVVAIERLTDTITSVDVHWDYTDREGVSQAEDGYRYLLRDTVDGPRIQVVVPTPLRLARKA